MNLSKVQATYGAGSCSLISTNSRGPHVAGQAGSTAWSCVHNYIITDTVRGRVGGGEGGRE